MKVTFKANGNGTYVWEIFGDEEEFDLKRVEELSRELNELRDRLRPTVEIVTAGRQEVNTAHDPEIDRVISLLTDKEEGLTTSGIAAELGLDYMTVRHYLQDLLSEDRVERSLRGGRQGFLFTLKRDKQ